MIVMRTAYAMAASAHAGSAQVGSARSDTPHPLAPVRINGGFGSGSRDPALELLHTCHSGDMSYGAVRSRAVEFLSTLPPALRLATARRATSMQWISGYSEGDSHLGGTYSDDMRGHFESARFNFSCLAIVERVLGIPLLKGNGIDLGAGAGDIEKVLHEVYALLNPERFKSLHFTLLDENPANEAVIKAKLHGLGISSRFLDGNFLERLSIRRESLDFLLRCQVLPWEVDPRAFVLENEGVAAGSESHTAARIRLVEDDLALLVPGGIHARFDESPMLASTIIAPDRVVENVLFELTTRRVDRNAYVNGVMKSDSIAALITFLAEFGYPVAPDHDGYLLA
ncbi:hypothetical protein HZC07_04100 [Candidatus Micrarchaeota archaeon]|nr:hypothetical protein [Candidatus Micrarchaeota archaeon]